jgi:putative serine protease PepD
MDNHDHAPEFTFLPPIAPEAVEASAESQAATLPATPTRERRGGLGRTTAAVVATALLAGGVGGAVGAAVTTGHDQPATSATSTDTGSISAASLDNSIESVSAKVLPSVVSIAFSGQAGSGTGSGIVITKDGVILTNNHVVAEAADGGSLTVSFQDGRTASAKILGRDPGADVAVVKVDGMDGLVPAQLGSSSSLKVGQQVVAIGSPLGLSGTVTSGIVSALNRPVVSGEQGSSATSVLNAIQTDAAVNPGNSGGALVDMAGRVVGINSAIASLGAAEGSQGGSIGLGFAIPIDQAKRIADELQSKGSATRAVLGVASENADGGARLTQVADGGAAAAAGLEVGDVVTAVGPTRITGTDSLLATVRSAAPGAKVDVAYTRAGTRASTTVVLGSADVQA